MKSRFFEVMAWIIGILGGIGSIVMGFQFTTGFNMGMTVICLISVAVLCMIFAGISCILKKLEFLCGEQDTEESNNGNTAEKTSSTDKWECPNCHCMNSYNNVAECPNCHWKA